MTPQEWQEQASLTATVVVDAFRFSGNNIRIIPDPTVNDSMVFEYISKFWVDTATVDGTADASTFTNNADEVVFDEELLTLGAIWRYKASKGFDYAEEFRSYEIKKARAQGDDGGNRVMNLGKGSLRRRPLVPQAQEGSWNLS